MNKEISQVVMLGMLLASCSAAQEGKSGILLDKFTPREQTYASIKNALDPTHRLMPDSSNSAYHGTENINSLLGRHQYCEQCGEAFDEKEGPIKLPCTHVVHQRCIPNNAHSQFWDNATCWVCLGEDKKGKVNALCGFCHQSKGSKSDVHHLASCNHWVHQSCIKDTAKKGEEAIPMLIPALTRSSIDDMPATNSFTIELKTLDHNDENLLYKTIAARRDLQCPDCAKKLTENDLSELGVMCVICREDESLRKSSERESNPLYQTTCGHSMHQTCMKSHIRSKLSSDEDSHIENIINEYATKGTLDRQMGNSISAVLGNKIKCPVCRNFLTRNNIADAFSDAEGSAYGSLKHRSFKNYKL